MTADEELQLGLKLCKAGNLPQGVEALRRAIELRPDLPVAYHYLGNALCDLKDWSQAVAIFTKAAELWPDHPQTHYDLALALYEMSEYAAAEAACRQALARHEANHQTHALLGLILRRRRRPDEAAAAYNRSLQLRPDQPQVLSNMGNALFDQGRAEDAAAAFTRAIQLQPNLPEAHNSLGNTLRAAGKFDEAEAAYRRALALRPDSLDAANNIGAVMSARGQWSEAAAVYRRIIGAHPDYAPAHWDLARILLGEGDYPAGWREYEWRWRVPDLRLGRRPNSPQWNGEDLNGESLLVFAEQGFGDAIQFVRFVPQLAQRGGRQTLRGGRQSLRGGKIILACRAELVPLFARVQGLAQCVPSDQPFPAHHLSCPLLSLAGILGVTLENLAAPQSYLTAHAQLAKTWAQRLAADTRRKIGLVWSGKSFPNPFRSVPPEQLEPIGKVAGIRWISLQTGDAAAQPPAGLDTLDLGGELRTFDDTAALIAGLDMVITIDTATTHLAGALGKPTWVLLQRFADWRWGREGQTCPWYPTMRLFRQERQGDWKAAVQELVSALAGL